MGTLDTNIKGGTIIWNIANMNIANSWNKLCTSLQLHGENGNEIQNKISINKDNWISSWTKTKGTLMKFKLTFPKAYDYKHYASNLLLQLHSLQYLDNSQGYVG